jgi:hypothetical protein
VRLGYLAAAVGTALLGLAGASQAATVYNFAETSSGVNLSATISISDGVYDAGLGEWIYTFNVQNTTADQDGLNSLVGFGFNVDPDGVTVGTTNTSLIFSFGGDVNNLGQGLGGFEFCYEVDANGNCSGNNPANALGEGEAAPAFQLGFDTGSDTVGVTFLNAFVRYQQVGANGDSEKIGNCSLTDTNCGGGGGGGVVPIPATLPLLAGALLGGGAFLRRKRKA